MNEWIPQFRKIVEDVPRSEYPDLAAELERARMQMQLNTTSTPQPESRATDEWVDATEAGKLIGMSRSWCYEHRSELSGRHHGAAVRFPMRGIRSYLERGSE